MNNPMNTELHGSSEHYLRVMVILNSECDHWFTIATWFFFNHAKGMGGVIIMTASQKTYLFGLVKEMREVLP
jgi:hypothetical protein